MSNPVHAVVLAAGKATRFGTGQSKQLVPVCGVPMVQHVVSELHALKLSVTVVLGHQADEISAMLTSHNQERCTIALQMAQRGTGHAVQCSQELWTGEHILIINGDMPLMTADALSSLIEQHIAANNALTFVTSELTDPTGYGRVVPGPVIREEKECTATEKEITTVNAGIYVVRRSFAERALAQLTASSVTGEIYITDLVAIAGGEAGGVGTYHIAAPFVRGVNTLAELAIAEHFLYERIRQQWLQRGVRLIDPSSILIEKNVSIGCGAVIGRGVHLQENTVIGERVIIEAYSMLRNAKVHNEAHVYGHSVIENSVVGTATQIGPFARLRDNAVIGDHAVVGNFVEIKKSTLGMAAKAKHLAYLGDAVVGEYSNIGAGTITCNYDGKNKHRTVIGDKVLIGANSSVVAPIAIENEAVIAAGSTITRAVPAGALGIGRARQENKEGWVMRKSLITPATSGGQENKNESVSEFSTRKNDRADEHAS